MYASPVIYPLDLVKNEFLVERAAGSWSDVQYLFFKRAEAYFADVI